MKIDTLKQRAAQYAEKRCQTLAQEEAKTFFTGVFEKDYLEVAKDVMDTIEKCIKRDFETVHHDHGSEIVAQFHFTVEDFLNDLKTELFEIE